MKFLLNKYYWLALVVYCFFVKFVRPYIGITNNTLNEVVNLIELIVIVGITCHFMVDDEDKQE